MARFIPATIRKALFKICAYSYMTCVKQNVNIYFFSKKIQYPRTGRPGARDYTAGRNTPL